MTNMDLLNETHDSLVNAVREVIVKELDWGDFFDVVRYVLDEEVYGDEIRQLENLVEQVYGV